VKISVIVPSRLAVNPVSEHGNLFLDRALMTIRRQSVYAAHDVQLIVGLDADGPEPPGRFTDVTFVRSDGKGQAKAVNAAAAVATGDVLAFLEDDDYWYPRKLELQLPHLERLYSWTQDKEGSLRRSTEVESSIGRDLVSCNSREIDEYANFVRVNNFPTPSGWIMKRGLWEKIGGFDESFRWHVDTEWLGRANAAGATRLHLINEGNLDERKWLPNIAQYSGVVALSDEPEPLVGRLVNPAGGMATIARDPVAQAESRREHERFLQKWGEVPW
jgi:glycosyltransferase involved in cell wall biosynthesis